MQDSSPMRNSKLSQVLKGYSGLQSINQDLDQERFKEQEEYSKVQTVITNGNKIFESHGIKTT